MRHLAAVAVFVVGSICGWALALYMLHPPGDSSSAASWIQAVGSIGAIAGAYWMGERQMRHAARAEKAGDLARRRAYAAIAHAAVEESVEIMNFLRMPDLNFSHIVSVAGQRRAAMAATALEGIPLHELGVAEAITAVSSMRRELSYLQDLFTDGARTIGLTTAETLYPNSPRQDDLRDNMIRLITEQVDAVQRDYRKLTDALGLEPQKVG